MADAQPQHSERLHALLGASSAKRWINCPPSARLGEKVPDTTSEYAEEGTAAHELSELRLRRRLTICDEAERKRLDTAVTDFCNSNKWYNSEMGSATQMYVDLVEERYHEAKARTADAVILLEERVDYSEWVPEGFGSCDVVLIADGVLEVIDLKYGKGVPVYAEENEQMRLYALGAWQAYNFLYDIEEIRMTIVQPRLDNISTDTIRVDDLLAWAETVVKPAALMAHHGNGVLKAGDHCRWCKVKATCRARADANMAMLAYEFKDPALLSLEEIGSILYIADQLSAWAKDVKDFAHEQATKHGAKIPQWKLVEGRSNRTITDKDAAKAALEAAGVEPDKYLKQELYGIGDLEKKVGKKELTEHIGGLIVKPKGKPTLVPETDKRPELNSFEDDFAGEEFDA